MLVAIIAALASAFMVASVIPFLTVVADPSRVQDVALLRWFNDVGGFQSTRDLLIALGLLTVGAILISNAIQMLRVWVMTRFTTMRIYSLSSNMLSSALGRPYEYFLNVHSGEFTTQTLAETQVAVTQYFKPVIEAIGGLLSVLAIVVLLIFVNPIVALSLFAVVGLIYGSTLTLSRSALTRAGKERNQANNSRYKVVGDMLGGIKHLKLMGHERLYLDRFKAPSLKMANAMVRAALIRELPHYVMQSVAFSSIIVICVVMLFSADGSSSSALADILPLLGVLAIAGQRILPEMAKFYKGLAQLQFGAAAIERIEAQRPTQTTPTKLTRRAPPPLGLRANVELENVTYRYPGTDLAGLTDISMTIHAGDRIGIVGSTGAGKTTLADVILGLLTPHEGALNVDDTEIDDGNIRAWQRSVGYVPQDIFLLDASITENIAMGEDLDKIDLEKVRASAKAAQLHAFIENELPDGYDTFTGERGIRLSGGQRQRIGIARALYHDADLIMFDEATSALDTSTENEVMSAIDALPGDKTVAMIAHRLSTIKTCDRIAVLDKGHLVGFGTWDDLEKSNPAFQRLIRAASKK
ncbi:MAG: ABC transporter ATP-binding protein [Henriciella sp.]|nr:ABC transporter ATP-binding protein [Henriciella sp.]